MPRGCTSTDALWLASLLLLACVPAAVTAELRFKADGTFKIVQLADLHFGQDEMDDMRTVQVRTSHAVVACMPVNPCGPAHGARCMMGPNSPTGCMQVVRTVLEQEEGVDLVVFSGDMLSGWMGRGVPGWAADKWVFRRLLASQGLHTACHTTLQRPASPLHVPTENLACRCGRPSPQHRPPPPTPSNQ